MQKRLIVAAMAAAVLLCAGPASAQSSFVNSCSNYGFTYSGNDAALEAVCLTNKNTPHQTTLKLLGISNQNGMLAYANNGQASSFQTSCGSIDIFAEGPYVTLSASCKSSSGYNETSLQLNNINNQDGNLVYGK
jgi:hypothetical protein